MSYITLREWNARLPLPRNMEVVRRWIRKGMIYPAPVIDGRTYLIQENAIKINPSKPKQIASENNKLILTERIKNKRHK